MAQKSNGYRDIVSKKKDGPNFARLVEVLTDEDLEDELRLGKGTPGFKEALRVEASRRGAARVAAA